jgi:tetratricopeptide (TPR) repeat protein
MSSLAELPELVGFFSYAREDDEDSRGRLSALRDAIQRELRGQLGRSKSTFRLWQDQAAIAPGKLWEMEITKAVDESIFFIPIVTPTAIKSKYCRFEFESFLAREKAIGRSDLVFPILYIDVPALKNEGKWRDDPVLSIIARRQYVDWRSLRHFDDTTDVREKIERLCEKIVEALNAPWTSPEERRRMEEAKAQQQAEEEARRLEAEAKRREKEEKRQAEAETWKRAEEERSRQKAEAKRRADEKERRKRAEVEDYSVQGSPYSGFVRVTAGVLAVLLLIGGGYAFLRHTVGQRDFDRDIANYSDEIRADHKAEAAAQAKAEQEAQEEARRQVKLGNDAMGLTIRGFGYADRGDFVQAMALYNEAIRLNPNLALAFAHRGFAYEQKGDYNRAMSDYDKAIQIDPKRAFAYCKRGTAKLKINDSSGNADIAKARQLDPQGYTGCGKL